MMLQPPEWFKAFIYCEAFLQLPFFPIAAYAFLKGGGNQGGEGMSWGRFCRTCCCRECFCIMVRGFEGGSVEGWAATAHTSVLPGKAAQNKVCQEQTLVTTGPCLWLFVKSPSAFDIWQISRAAKGLGQACVLILLL